MNSKPTLFWITGLSGAGKTTIGKNLYHKIKSKNSHVVFLDGDELRKIFAKENAHSLEERKKLAMSYSRLCKFLIDQGFHVVCATISMFHEVREWNRDNIDNYFEIYLKVPIEILIDRDPKQIYKKAQNGELKNVVGLDMLMEEPEKPDITIINDGSMSVDQIVKNVWSTLTPAL